MAMARSAARRFATGAVHVTTMGCATPTTCPAVGSTDSTAKSGDWFAAARLEPAGTATTLAATTITVRTHRTPRMDPNLVECSGLFRLLRGALSWRLKWTDRG